MEESPLLLITLRWENAAYTCGQGGFLVLHPRMDRLTHQAPLPPHQCASHRVRPWTSLSLPRKTERNGQATQAQTQIPNSSINSGPTILPEETSEGTLC